MIWVRTILVISFLGLIQLSCGRTDQSFGGFLTRTTSSGSEEGPVENQCPTQDYGFTCRAGYIAVMCHIPIANAGLARTKFINLGGMGIHFEHGDRLMACVPPDASLNPYTENAPCQINP